LDIKWRHKYVLTSPVASGWRWQNLSFFCVDLLTWQFLYCN